MPRRFLVIGAALLGVLALHGEAAAQRRGAPAAPAGPPPATAETLELIYEREVFSYSGGGRRDPFAPLTNENEMGPRFESLSLQGIIYSTVSRNSVALLADTDGRVHRVRVGDVIGNATVLEIGPLRVVLAVENFGSIRQEMLELQRNQGANR